MTEQPPPSDPAFFPSLVSAGGIILCGGESTRMGKPKAWLPFGEEFLLQRLVRIMQGVVSPLVVVGAPGQQLPDLPVTVRRIADAVLGWGPLAGLAAGLASLRAECEIAFVVACDLPLLRREFVTLVLNALGSAEIAIPVDSSGEHPLAGAYRTQLAGEVEALLATGERRMRRFLNLRRVYRIPMEEWSRADPRGDSLRNINTPGEYAAALRAQQSETRPCEHE